MEKLVNIDEFVESDLLYESNKSKVFKASHPESSRNIIVKQLNKQFPSAEDIEQFLQEFEVSHSLESTYGISSYQMAQKGSAYYLIMDEFEGLPLSSQIGKNQITLKSALEIAIELAEIIGNIHNKNIIHKDINPSNILWDDKSNKVRIIDFGISSRLSRDINEIMTLKQFDGTLQYISPEQTGRIDRAVDYRADLYSLGITLYQIISGRLPFAGTDAIELVHSHIAKNPEPLYKITENIPGILSDIIMKLLAKNPDERYQSAQGLKQDLEICLEQLQKKGKIDDFELGTNDHSGRFQITHKIYGRKSEIDRLIESFHRARNGNNELVMISGYSGIGKSLLVTEIHKPVIQNNGIFIKGQYDRFKKDVPLHGLAQAFNELIIGLLSGTEKALSKWKNSFVKTFGPNGKIITDIIPDMEQIIGEQPNTQNLNPLEATNRIIMMFRNFIRVIAQKEHPLVIFLDDVQWSDQLSLQLIKDIAINEIPFVMLICAFRSNEEYKEHMVNLTFSEIEKARNFEKLHVDNLPLDAVKQLIADSLHCSIDDTTELSESIYSKTHGNPFFTKQLLKTLYRENYLKFNYRKNSWQWDINEIRNAQIADNLIDVVKDRIQKLPNECIDALKIASCVGGKFDLQTISSLLNKPALEVSSLLVSALDEGIIYAQGNRLEMVVNGNESSTNVSYKFQHYRIQQIIQGMLSEDNRNEVHFKIGQHYLNFLPDNIRNEQLIEITHHLNFGLHLIPSTEGKIRFAEYNLQAANKAMASAAYSSAIVFFEKGMQLLPGDSKDANYDLWISLNKGFAECAYQVGRYDNAEEAIDNLLHKISDNLDKASVIAMRLRQYATMGKPHEAITEGIKALALLGVKLSPNPGMGTVLRELIKARLRQGNRKTSSLIDLPVTNNPKMKMTARLLTEMGAPAYTLGNDNLYGILALKVVNLSLKYGYTHELPYALVAYGMLKTIAFGNMKEGNNLGNLAIALNDKYNDLEYRCRVIAAYGVLIHHWNHHWSSLTSWFKKGIEAGIHSGDIFYLSHSASNCVVWDPKLNLINKTEEHKKFVDIIRETGFTDAIDTSEMRLQLLRNLREETINRFSLTSHEFFEEKRLNEMSGRKYISGIAMYHITKSEIYLLYNNPEKAYQHIEKADDIMKALIGLNYTLLLSVTAFHAASQLLSKKGLSKEDQSKYWRRMEKEFKQMKKWSRHNPENYRHHLQIMEAEMLKHHGKYNKATSFYKKAIESAGKNLWLKDEAFFNEVTAKFFIEQNLVSASTGYIKQAFYLYKRLGTNAKVSQLLEEYPELEEFLNTKTNFSDFDSISIKQSSHSTTNGSIGILDMNTITKASQTISSEIILDTLLKKLMQITIENVGAQRGVLLLNENDNLRVQAENNVDDNTIMVLQSIPLQEYARIPHTLINYVINSRKNVVLSHAYFEGNFTQDPYIIKHQPKSVLAEPIIKQNQLYGIIYFENNLNTGVFSEERQMMLSILVTQIAISIENSIMYENLEEKIKERTFELTEANRQLTKKNEQIEKQKVELEKLNASKDKMFSIIAHDLRSPFNSILIGTQLLSRNVLDYSKKEIEDFVKGIHQSSQKVFNLLENLLNWAMSQTGRTVFEPQNIELIDLVNEVIEIAEESSLQKNIRIESSVAEDLAVYADQHMLYTVLRNLTNNAIKYCHWGGLIQISAKNSAQITQITVKDDGVGIPEEKIGKLFDISEKTSTPGTNDEKGTGLGLILCKEFIEKHHGEIWVQSKPDEGCTFHFTIPDKR